MSHASSSWPVELSADGRSQPTTTHVLAQTMRSLAAWVYFDQVPKDPVVSNCSLLCQKTRFMLYRGSKVEASINWKSEFWNSRQVRNTSRRAEMWAWGAKRGKGMDMKMSMFHVTRTRLLTFNQNVTNFKADVTFNLLAGWQQTVDSVLYIGDFIFFQDTCLLVVYIKYLKIGSVKGLHSILQLCALRAWQTPVVG